MSGLDSWRQGVREARWILVCGMSLMALGTLLRLIGKA